MNWKPVAISVLLLVSAWLPSATACPYCKSEIGTQVEAGIFNGQFWSNVALTLLPLFVLLAIVALIHFDVARLWNGNVRSNNQAESEHLTGD